MNPLLRYQIAGDLIRFHLEGDYPAADLLDLFRRAFDDPHAPERALVLIDARLATVERSSEDVRSLAEAYAEWAPRTVRSAILVATDLHFGLSRMGSQIADGHGVTSKVFRQEQEALAYLGLPARAPEG